MTRSTVVSIPVWFDWEQKAYMPMRKVLQVSIPVWFDWENDANMISRLKYKVSIPVWFDWEPLEHLQVCGWCSSFNSSMVRLGEANIFSYKQIISAFQFQYGSIGSVDLRHVSTFKFLVSIPVWFDWESTTDEKTVCGIRVSIPVWFDWEEVKLLRKYYKTKFQFQYGSIGRWFVIRKPARSMAVSIPVWFDWELFTNSFSRIAIIVSIPVWFDWE